MNIDNVWLINKVMLELWTTLIPFSNFISLKKDKILYSYMCSILHADTFFAIFLQNHHKDNVRFRLQSKETPKHKFKCFTYPHRSIFLFFFI